VAEAVPEFALEYIRKKQSRAYEAEARAENAEADLATAKESEKETLQFIVALCVWVRRQHDKAGTDAWGNGRKQMCADILARLPRCAAVEQAEEVK
jgi:hypothetical protein